MSTLHVYGDSYVDPRFDMYSLSWPARVAGKLGYAVRNSGISGSSLGYSMTQFAQDLEQGLHQPGDAVIYIVTDPMRLNFEYIINELPTIANSFNFLNKNIPEQQWLWANKSEIEWSIANQHRKFTEIQAHACIHMLKSYAELNPGITVFVMQICGFHQMLPVKTTAKNFLYQEHLHLNTIQCNERTHTPGAGDPTINHLTEPNLNKLADLVTQAIQTQTIQPWHADQFLQGILTYPKTLDDYHELINQGLVPYMPWYADNWWYKP